MDPDPSVLIVLFIAIDFSVISGFVLLCVMLCCSALISGAEVALFSLTASDIDDAQEQNSKRIQIISKLLEQPKKIMALNNIRVILIFQSLILFQILPKDH